MNQSEDQNVLDSSWFEVRKVFSLYSGRKKLQKPLLRFKTPT